MPLPPTPAASPQMGDSRPPSGSPSSDTPETDAATHLMQQAPNQWRAVVDAEFAEKLERDRDEARHALKAGGMLDIIDRAAHDRAAAIRERDEIIKILDDLDEIFHLMRPRWHQTPSMCGRYPCWIVWLPKEGTCERKTLREAVIECAEQMIPENAEAVATASTAAPQP